MGEVSVARPLSVPQGVEEGVTLGGIDSQSRCTRVYGDLRNGESSAASHRLRMVRATDDEHKPCNL